MIGLHITRRLVILQLETRSYSHRVLRTTLLRPYFWMDSNNIWQHYARSSGLEYQNFDIVGNSCAIQDVSNIFRWRFRRYSAQFIINGGFKKKHYFATLWVLMILEQRVVRLVAYVHNGRLQQKCGKTS